MTMLRIEQISHNLKDQKCNFFFYLEQVNFLVALIIYCRVPARWGTYTIYASFFA